MVVSELGEEKVQLFETEVVCGEGVVGLVELLHRLNKVDCLLLSYSTTSSHLISQVHSVIVNVFGAQNLQLVSDDVVSLELGYSGTVIKRN